MNYLVEEISPEDRSKILNDAQTSPKLLRLLERTEYLKQENIKLRWAVDKDVYSYLLSAPRPLPEPTMDTHYLFYFDRTMLLLRVAGAFGQKAQICNPEVIQNGTQHRIHELILGAFSKYGRFGDGTAGDLRITEVSLDKA